MYELSYIKLQYSKLWSGRAKETKNEILTENEMNFHAINWF